MGSDHTGIAIVQQAAASSGERSAMGAAPSLAQLAGVGRWEATFAESLPAPVSQSLPTAGARRLPSTRVDELEAELGW